MKPSERINELAQLRTLGGLNLDGTWTINVHDVRAYLDEEAERRAAFEADVLKRLEKVERKTSSTEIVELYETTLNPQIARVYRVKFREPEPTPGYEPTEESEEP